MSQVFDQGRLYYWEQEIPSSFFGLPKEEVNAMYEDGRSLSPLIHRVIVNKFSNLSSLFDDDSPDIINSLDVKSHELRGMSKKSKEVKLYQSGMIGMGRDYNEPKFRLKLEKEISGFVIANSNFGLKHLFVFFVPSDYVLSLNNIRSLSAKQMYEFTGYDFEACLKQLNGAKEFSWPLKQIKCTPKVFGMLKTKQLTSLFPKH